MASLIRFAVGRTIPVSRTANCPLLKGNTAAVAASARYYWNRDWRPTAYPQTEAEREASAKKYGLRKEDYIPCPDNDFSKGDYPMLPPAPIDIRDPNEEYDMPEIKRNYGEPLHWQADLYREFQYAGTNRYPYSRIFMLAVWLSVMSSIIGIYCLGWIYQGFHPTLPKQLPYEWKSPKRERQVHYIFEPLD